MPGRAQHRGHGGCSLGRGRSGHLGEVCGRLGRRGLTSARAGKTLLLKHGSLLNSTGFEKTQPNAHLCLTLNQHLTCWRKTKSMISEKAPPRCTGLHVRQLHGKLLLVLCLVTTSTSLLSFNVFLYFFFLQITCSSVLRLLPQLIPTKHGANTYAPGLHHSPLCLCARTSTFSPSCGTLPRIQRLERVA